MIDLHTHSHFSDGTISPTELVALAEKKGLEAIALCDHNTVSGLPEFMEAGKNSSVETIPATELTAVYKEKELHILAFFIPETQYNAITQKMSPFRKAKEESNRRLLQALQAEGFRLDEARIFHGSLDYVNRFAFARELTRCGYTASAAEAFDKYLSPGLGYYEPVPREDAFEIIGFIRSIGALPVLAHPLHSVSEETLRSFLPRAKDAGLVAIETCYSKYDPSKTQLAHALQKEFGLLESGGSDYHGESDSDIQIGIGKGNLRIPYSVLTDLKRLL